jgi:hypothetical protein
VSLVSPILTWRQKLVWRHYILWSHRADLFLIIMVATVVLSIVGAALYVQTMAASENRFLVDISNYPLAQDKTRSLLTTARSRRPTIEEEQALTSIELPATGGGYYYYLTDSDVQAELKKRAQSSLENLSPAVLDSMKAQIRFPYYAAYQVSRMYDYYDTAVVAFVAALLPLILMAFFVANVFYERGTNYPHFALMASGLVCIGALPVLVAVVAQTIVNSNVVEVVTKAKPIAEGVPLNLDSFEVPRAIDVFLSAMSDANATFVVRPEVYFAFALIFWLAGATWIIKRFGWNLFLVCSLLALSVVFVGLFAAENVVILSIDRQLGPLLDLGLVSVPGERAAFNIFMLALLCCMALFGVGAIFKFYREYTLSASYLGAVTVLPAIVFASFSTCSPGVLGACAILALLVVIAFTIELALRRQIARILEQPR